MGGGGSSNFCLRNGEDWWGRVGGGRSAAKPLNFIGKFLLRRRSRRLGGYTIYLCNLGKLAKRGGGGYPQALPKVINLQGLLELSEILVLIEKLPHRALKKKDSKRESKKWVPHRDPVECSGLLTRLRLTHYGYRLTALHNKIRQMLEGFGIFWENLIFELKHFLQIPL